MVSQQVWLILSACCSCSEKMTNWTQWLIFFVLSKNVWRKYVLLFKTYDHTELSWKNRNQGWELNSEKQCFLFGQIHNLCVCVWCGVYFISTVNVKTILFHSLLSFMLFSKNNTNSFLNKGVNLTVFWRKKLTHTRKRMHTHSLYLSLWITRTYSLAYITRKISRIQNKNTTRITETNILFFSLRSHD